MVINEELKGSHMIIYHRTKNKQIKDILSKGEFIGGGGTGALYGKGLYTTYEDYSEESDNALNYGNITIQFKVTLDNFLVLDYYIFDQLASYKKTLEQFNYKKTKKHKPIDTHSFIDIQLQYYGISNIDSEYMKIHKNEYSSELFIHIYENNPYISNVINGAIYTGAQDGKCCLVYNVTKAIPLAIRSPQSKYKWVNILNAKEMLKYLKYIYTYGSKGISSKADKIPDGKLKNINEPIDNQKIYSKQIKNVPINNSELYKCDISRVQSTSFNQDSIIKKSKIYLSHISNSEIYNSLLHKCKSFEIEIKKSIITKGFTQKSTIENSKLIDGEFRSNGVHDSDIVGCEFNADYIQNSKIVNSTVSGGETKRNICVNTSVSWSEHSFDKFNKCIISNAVGMHIQSVNSKIIHSHIESSELSKCKIQKSQLLKTKLYSCEIMDLGMEADLEINTLIDNCVFYDCTIQMADGNLYELIEILNLLNRGYKVTKNGVYIGGEISTDLFTQYTDMFSKKFF